MRDTRMHGWTVLVGLVAVGICLILSSADPRAEERAYAPVPRLVHAMEDSASSPFYRGSSPVIAWEAAAAAGESPRAYRLELALDEEMTDVVFRAVGTGSGLRLPEGSVAEGRRYFMRLQVADGQGGWTDWTDPDWFAMDPRHLGLSNVSAHHYPFGKIANHNLVRDPRGRIHFVMAPLMGARRQLIYAWTEDDGYTWNMMRLSRERADHKVINPTLVLSADGRTLHLAWGEYVRFPGHLVTTTLDLTGEPVVVSAPRTVSTKGTPYCLCTMASMALDSSGSVHVAWQVGCSPNDCSIAYANNRQGWGQAVHVTSSQQTGIGPTLRLDDRDRIHLLWEGARYHRSDDNGRTWSPAFDQGARQLFPELAEQGLRARHCALAVSPDRSRVYALCSAEELLPTLDGKPRWASSLNTHQLWLREIDGDEWTEARCIYSIDARVLSREEAEENADGARFMLFPSVSTSPDGRLAVAWQEMAVQGKDKIIAAYGMVSEPDGTWAAPFEIGARPESASVSPFLAPHFDGSLDVVWTESGHYDWRRFLGADLEQESFDLYNLYHGVFYSRLSLEGRDPLAPDPRGVDPLGAVEPWSSLESRLGSEEGAVAASTGGGRRLSWVDAEPRQHHPDAREGLPDLITMPKSCPAAAPPTGPTNTPTRTPTPTVTPSATATAQGTPVTVQCAEDAWVYSSYPNNNYGDLDYLNLSLVNNSERRAYLKFPIPFGGPEDEITRATLILYPTHSNETQVKPYQVDEFWDELELTWNDMPADHEVIEDPTRLPERYSFFHLDVTDIVRNWILHQEENHGFCLRQEPVMSSQLTRFRSREYGGTGQRPRLVIGYIDNDATPTPTPFIPTPTPTPNDVSIRVATNQDTYFAGDHFMAYALLQNPGDHLVIPLRVYIVLEAFGEYFFWPDWTNDLNYMDMTFEPGDLFLDTILEADLPDPLPAGGPFFLWGAGFHRSTGRLKTNVSLDAFVFM